MMALRAASICVEISRKVSGESGSVGITVDLP
jgi:hypothetical protein